MQTTSITVLKLSGALSETALIFCEAHPDVTIHEVLEACDELRARMVEQLMKVKQ